MNFLGNIEIIKNTSGLITVNETLLVQVLSFLIFMFIINRIMFRPLLKTMDQRDEYVENIKKDIHEADIAILDVTKQIEKAESTLKAEAQQRKKQLETEGRHQATEAHEAYLKEINQLKEHTEKQITNQIEEARQQIQNEFEIISVTIMEKILERSLVK